MKLVNFRRAALAGAILLSGCSAQQEGSNLDTLRQQGFVKIGFANEAPYGYLDPESGRITGEAPEIAQVIFARLGVKVVEPVVTEWGSLIPGLKAGRFDVIAAGMYITPERAREVLFSNPTYSIGEGFIVAKGNPKGLHSFEEAARSDSATLGVVAGTVEVGYARKLGVPEQRLIQFPDNASALAGVASGRVDAWAGTILTIKDLLSKAKNPKLEKAEPFTQPVINGKPMVGYGAFAFRKANKPLVDAFNKELAKFIGTEEHLSLVKPFGFGKDTLPGDVTTANLISSH